MVSELLYNNHENSFWTIWQTSIGSLLCLCCIVFLGLKLKWFRAQLKLGDAPTQNKSSAVQGVGFKLKSNPDDFQLYKVTSEFSTPINQKQSNENVEIKRPPVTIRQVTNNSQISMQNISKTKLELNSNTSISSTVDSKIQEHIYDNMQNKDKVLESTKIKVTKSEHKVTEVKKDEVKKSEVLNKKTTTPKSDKMKQEDLPQTNLKKQAEFDPSPIEITNPSAIKFSDLINKPKNEPKNEYDIEVNKNQKLIETVKHPIQIKNPLASQNFEMPSETEDDWKIKIVDEKPKKRTEEIEENNSYFTASTSNMYSSQAASIFFGGQAPEIQPRARKFVEMDEDNFSTGSQTSA